MARTTRGISPEKLRELKERLEALPEIEPEFIPTRIAITEIKAQFRSAMTRGYSIEQLADLWNAYGSPIKDRTLAGYLRNPAGRKKAARKTAAAGAKSASSRAPERQVGTETAGPVIDQQPAERRPQVSEGGPHTTDAGKRNDTAQTADSTRAFTREEEDAAVDEIIARRRAASSAGSGHGQGG